MFAFLRPLSGPTHSARLYGPRVYLRAPRGGDWRVWSQVRTASREFLEPWEPTWPKGAVGRSAFRHRLRRQARESRDDSGYAFFVFGRDDDSLLGGVTLSNLQRGVAMSCSLGYWVGAQHTRQGFMSEAITSLLPFVFDTLGLHRLEAACLPSNIASQGLLRKLGFHEEGFARDYLRINGQWHDHLLFALLTSDRDGKKR